MKMAQLTEQERERVIRGEGFSRPPVRRVYRGVSREADHLFSALQRSSRGERSLRSLVQGPLSSWTGAAVAELEQLGLVERVGGSEPRVRLTAEADGVMLVSSWSMTG